MKLVIPLLLAIGALGFVSPAWSAPANEAPADNVVADGVVPSEAAPSNSLRADWFAALSAEVLADELLLRWSPPDGVTTDDAVAWVSWGAPGHWPTREWLTAPLRPRGLVLGVAVPVEFVDRPIVYFVRVVQGGVTNTSPVRVCRPRRLGLDHPTAVFWPFLEGFEQGTGHWQALGKPPASFALTDEAKDGRAALSVRIPADAHSTRVGTTRLRDWQVTDHEADGVSLWLRTRTGEGRARFTLHGNAFTPAAVTSTSTNEVTLQPRWQRFDVPFTRFRKPPLTELDFLSIEFLGPPGQEFLLDDLQLLGPWPVD